MNTFQIALAAAVLGLLLCWWWLRRNQADSSFHASSAPSDRVDTVAGWPPQPTRLLSSPERVAFSTLVRALPEYIVLAQVPLSRFLSVPKRNSYADWLRRVGYQCVDFAVCDMNAQVVAVIELQADAAPLSERAKKRLTRMTRALQAASIPLLQWRSDALPSVAAVRAAIAPKPVVAPAPAKVLAESVIAAAAATSAIATPVRSPFEDSARDESHDERIELLEPPPSTWFDDLDSEPMPLSDASAATPARPARIHAH